MDRALWPVTLAPLALREAQSHRLHLCPIRWQRTKKKTMTTLLHRPMTWQEIVLSILACERRRRRYSHCCCCCSLLGIESVMKLVTLLNVGLSCTLRLPWSRVRVVKELLF